MKKKDENGVPIFLCNDFTCKTIISILSFAAECTVS